MDAGSCLIEQTSKLGSRRYKNPEMSIDIPMGDCEINSNDKENLKASTVVYLEDKRPGELINLRSPAP
jgi:hypothetical protein